MKNILIFRTVDDKRIQKLINEFIENSDITIILPHKYEKFYKTYNLNVTCLVTEKEYIDFESISTKKELHEKCFDLAIIPSSSEDNYFSFGECFCILEKIKCKKIIWENVKGKRKLVKNSYSVKVINMIKGYVALFFIGCGKYYNRLYSFVNNYRW